MRELFFEVPYLLLMLGVIEFKCFVLRAQNSILRFKRRIFVIRERNALAKYRSRAMLGNQFFEAVEQSHVDTPNVQIEGLRAFAQSLSNAGLALNSTNLFCLSR